MEETIDREMINPGFENRKFIEESTRQTMEELEKTFAENQRIIDENLRKMEEMTSRTPVTIWSFDYNAEEVITLYGALAIYLKTLCQQSQDYEMIARVARLMGEMKAAAVKASQELAERENNGIENK